MENYGKSGKIMEHHGTSKKIIENPGKAWKTIENHKHPIRLQSGRSHSTNQVLAPTIVIRGQGR